MRGVPSLVESAFGKGGKSDLDLPMREKDPHQQKVVVQSEKLCHKEEIALAEKKQEKNVGVAEGGDKEIISGCNLAGERKRNDRPV